ncbi:MAE_28990/MAE_18760 family HEPN-like nuclease [Kurthia sibirica]|uniref:RiboL-PSP-HEPN domain-containing protein n=1 Tax=Kurthia sibirica TaxID=202750 RepID=A0A2U3AKB8_9BACL|nr:MAE_28990/MAE_18760 family HEPN-like nuclease [Kurthia sibirica]PWI24977.1 hypothetical protein DEX24_10405 [Kurthia sibirica]GEK33117.1 hypothetical protein KSI01_06500 [Kurthia sibirica]
MSSENTKNPLEKLQKRLDKDFTWRKKELTIARSNIDGSTGETLNFNLKVATTTLYSHWEGFIKTSSISYLDYLNKKKYILSDFKNCFKILHFTKNILEIKHSTKKSKFLELYETFSKENEEIFLVNTKGNHLINTQSNLNYEVLEEILLSLSLDITQFQTKDNLIDANLLNIRNKIAHGEYYSYLDTTNYNLDMEKQTKSNFLILYDDILTLMETFKDMIIDAALDESYLAN